MKIFNVCFLFIFGLNQSLHVRGNLFDRKESGTIAGTVSTAGEAFAKGKRALCAKEETGVGEDDAGPGVLSPPRIIARSKSCVFEREPTR